MDNDEIYTIDLTGSTIVDYGNTIDIATIDGTIQKVWLNTDDSKYYVHDGVHWNVTDEIYIPKEWENSFPDYHTIKEMSKEYPALEKALENFKLVYELTKQDWIGKQKDGPSI